MEHKTPVKESPLHAHAMDMTPSPLADPNYLIGSLSAMKINHGMESSLEDAHTCDDHSDEPEGRMKRHFSERYTVEGSPFISGADIKRRDVLPTPAKVSFNIDPIAEELTHVGLAVASIDASPTSLTAGIAATATPTISRSDGVQKVLVICSASDEHDTGNHQENALRTALLCGPEGCLRRKALADFVEWVDTDKLSSPPISDLLRVHEFEYLDHLEKKCRKEVNHLPYFCAPEGLLDTDTPLVSHSYDAAKRFCSAAILAIDKVMNPSSEHKRAFVIGRPPGHHAGPNGGVPSSTFWKRPDMMSSGFCLLNTVAVAAAYARYNYGRHNYASEKTRSHAPRIAIVDIDIHHGNGTEEIVRNLEPHLTYLPLPSSWAPVSKMTYKPWFNEKDKEEVFFSSIHLFGGEQFYPGSGQEMLNATSSSSSARCPIGSTHNSNIVNIELTPIDPGPWNHIARAKLTPAKREAICKQASQEFRSKVTAMLLPKLREFQPELLIISAGFDAHYDDFYHFLTEEDIHWITDEMCRIVDGCGGYGVVSVLEGGYSLSSPIIAAPVTKSSAKGKDGDSHGTRGKKKAVAGGKEDANVQSPPAVCAPVDVYTMFAQQPGDGGLVKGVLAHAAALVGKSQWL